ncbi:MAG: hypothetical protein ACOY40_19125 [Bacillota bacterium]
MRYVTKLLKIDSFPALILWGLGTIAGYFFLFSNNEVFLVIMSGKSYISAMYSMIITLAAAILYGNTILIISRKTVEKALKLKDKEKG